MAEFDQLAREISRGNAARQVLENALFKESWAVVENAIIERWRNSPIADREGQHELRLMLHILASVKNELTTVLDTGKLATEQHERSLKQKVTDRVKEWFEN